MDRLQTRNQSFISMHDMSEISPANIAEDALQTSRYAERADAFNARDTDIVVTKCTKTVRL